VLREALADLETDEIRELRVRGDIALRHRDDDDGHPRVVRRLEARHRFVHDAIERAHDEDRTLGARRGEERARGLDIGEIDELPHAPRSWQVEERRAAAFHLDPSRRDLRGVRERARECRLAMTVGAEERDDDVRRDRLRHGDQCRPGGVGRLRRNNGAEKAPARR